MHLRLVEALVKEHREPRLRALYTAAILPALDKTPGCVLAGLLHRHEQPRSFVSLTLWTSEEAAEDYVRSGTYDENVAIVEELFEEESEWKIQLSKDNTVEFAPVKKAPALRTYPVARDDASVPSTVPASAAVFRILSLTLQQGKRAEFKEVYNRWVLPALRAEEGCFYAFLIDDAEREGEMVSVSLWDSMASVHRYEQDGRYQALLDKLRPTLGELYQWKMALQRQSPTATAVTSQDIDVRTFSLITAKRFQ
ncbi:MAG: hypothetical protein GVY12_05585 [Bacteroidetes bacterium]|jgi:quinol monooxygenase YgiN|nr:hypothetical protein [Bacteroidota bacterium]